MNRLYQKPAEWLTLEDDEGDDNDGVVLVLIKYPTVFMIVVGSETKVNLNYIVIATLLLAMFFLRNFIKIIMIHKKCFL
jgi:hypothetical protein